MATIVETAVCHYCQTHKPIEQTRYIARYDLAVCLDCFMAYN
jgi:hypothetical protein